MKTAMACLTMTLLAWPAAAQTAQGTQNPSTDAKQGMQNPSTDAKTSQRSAMSIRIDQFEQNRDQYIGKKVTITNAAVNNVLGPHLFTVNDGNWFDLQGDTLVYLPAPLVGLVSDDAQVNVTGTVKRFTEVDLNREWDWFYTRPTLEAEITSRPVLVAETIVSDNGLALAVNMTDRDRSQAAKSEPSAGQSATTGATGTSGSAANGAKRSSTMTIDSVDQLTRKSNRDLLGSDVKLTGVKVAQTAQKKGRFFIDGPQGERILVVAADGTANVAAGQAVRLDGIVLEMPQAMRRSIGSGTKAAQPQNVNDQIYIYAHVQGA